MPAIFDAAAHKQLVSEALDYLRGDDNLTMYYQWALVHKRCWSDSMAGWCQCQTDLTDQRITQRWRTHGAQHREQDLQDKIREVWDKVKNKSQSVEIEVESKPQSSELPI